MQTQDTFRNEAWQRMFQLRTCPPISVLQKGGSFVEAHLRSCSDCRESLANAQIFAELGALFAKGQRSPSTATKPAIGDIRRLRPSSSSETWFNDEGIYHNPPLVLVLTVPDNQGFVQVAQIFEEEDLCAYGDIRLDESHFAEAWNSYGLPVSALADKAISTVDTRIVERVRKARNAQFPPIDTLSALYYFRQMEMALGSFFFRVLLQG